jgi:cytochrome c oxidase accessory protein FixG
VLVGANLLWYFVTPGDFIRRLLANDLGPVLAGSWAVLAAASFGNLAFLRQRFCATVCPYARLQGALFDRHTLVVAYDDRRTADCIDCGACVRVCPTGIDIRRGLQMACIACAECIDACEPIMRKLGRAPRLVGYFFGDPGTPRRLVRPVVAALAAATAISLAATAAVAAGRSALDLNVSPAASYAPRLAADGRAVNAYNVSLENRGRDAMTVRLGLAARAAETDLQPREVVLSPGEHRRVTVLAMARGLGGPGPVAAELSAEAEGGRGRETRRVPFVVPGGP